MNPASQTDERMPNKETQIKSQAVRKILHGSSYNLAPTRINADDQTKLKLCCYPAVFIATIILLSLIASFALPRALTRLDPNRWKQGNVVKFCNTHLQLNNKTVKCSETNTNYTKTGSYVSDLQPLNQFLVLYLTIDKKIYHRSNINLNQNVNFQLYSAQPNNGEIVVKDLIQSKTLNLVGPINKVFEDQKFFILYMSKLKSNEQFYWQLSLSNSSQLASSTYFLQTQIVNAKFSLFTIILRVVLFLVSLIVFLKYNQLISRMPRGKVSIEQRLIQVLSVVNLVFNDQLYFISVIAPNPFSSFLSSFFLWNFVVYLFIIWAFFLNRIINDEPQTQTYLFTPARVVITTIFYVIVLAYSVTYAITQTTDHPVFSYEDTQSNSVIALEIFAFIIFILACVYIIHLFIQVKRKRPDRLHRHNIFLGYTLIFFISTIAFFFVGGYNLFNYSAAKILFTLCFMNMYSFYLQYFYTPTQNQMKKFERQAKLIKFGPEVQPQELIEIPQSGQVEICLIQTSQKSQKISNEQDQNQNSLSEQKQQESLSARQKRRRNRKKKMAKQQEPNKEQNAESNSQINNQQYETQKDQFS